MSETFAFDTLGPLRGYRLWRVADGLLHSPARGDAWLPLEPFRARCPHATVLDERRLPHARCTCGIYATRHLSTVLPQRNLPLSGRFSGWIIGEVRLWGRVFEHEHGWRAEWAYPIGLYPTWPAPADEPMGALFERYELEALPFPEGSDPPAWGGANPGGSRLAWLIERSRWGEDPPGQLVPA